MSSGSSSSGCVAYCERSDVEAVYGVENVKKWADLDNDVDPVKIEARITWARCLASERINVRLASSPYDVPFLEPFPDVLVDITARLSGLLLHDSRGVEDLDAEGRPTDVLQTHRNEYARFIQDVYAGRIRFPELTSTKRVPGAFSL